MPRLTPLSVLVVPLLLAACGGGGGESAQPAGAGPLAKYAGTATYCDGHERGTLTTTVSPDGYSASLSLVSTYHQDANCAGAVVGTETMSTAISATYISTGNATVPSWPTPSASTAVAVDRVSLASPAGTRTLAGPGVSLINGQLCVSYTNGRTCLGSTGYGALSAVGGLALTGNALLLLEATPSGYQLDTAFQR